MARRTYRETFDEGPGGWLSWASNFEGARRLESRPGTLTSRSPWWIDYNHAPPGAGYMHLPFAMGTSGPQPEAVREIGGPNRFIAGGFPTDFTGARLVLRLRGELRRQGAELVVLIQGVVDGLCSGWLRTGQPIAVGEQWSQAEVELPADPAGWTALGTRHDRTDMYGVRPLAKVLGAVSTNILLVMFPLTIEPMGPLDGDPHRLRAGHDYPVWRSRLPEGYITLDTVEIAFP